MSRFRVLLVDDEEELTSTLVERLRLRDIEAEGATSGAEALDLVAREDFDVVVLDVKMPKMGGVECLTKIKEMKPDLHVILLTGHGSHEDRQDGLAEGAFDYVMKPIRIEDLIRKMEQAVRQGEGGGPHA